MKKLIISIIILLFIGCSSDKTVSFNNEDPWIYTDDWYGVAELIYPGPDDAPLYDSAAILNLALDNKGNYHYSTCEISTLPMPVVIENVSGKYYIRWESITFIPDITDRPSRTAKLIEGTYSLHLDRQGKRMTLTKILHPDSWPEIHTVMLDYIEYEFVLFRQ